MDPDAPSLKVIADHIRACAFTVAVDGVIPATKAAVRAAPHRAPRHPPRLQAGARKPVLPHLAAALADEMGDAYPSCGATQRITEVLKAEEERFFQTIANGMEILETAARRAPGSWTARRPSAARHLWLPRWT